ncbi:HAD family hydrolase [Actinomyces gaoshouyii]|uniref:Haloacid dehalogenase n=1 Tax=Actinomyces gaoshouyii TaxID=1960083 RepID=A0A8H9HE38_9ACTO|nr:HAD family phosphatase [Actinomyces gaoshouyii]GGO97913.1 haloacid dehalogenase [Actinomyces gaoshouyii]
MSTASNCEHVSTGSASLAHPVGLTRADPTQSRHPSARQSAGRARARIAGTADGVDAIILDLGNVLYAWEAVAAVAGRVSLPAWEEFCAGADFTALNRRSDLGEDFDAIVADLAAAHPGRPDWVDILRTYRACFRDSLTGPVPGMEGLVDELLAAGLPLHCLTNYDGPTFDDTRDLVPQLDRFAGIVVSGKEHLIKPDPAIFRVALERFGLEPSRTLFIDDSPANTASASGMGILTHTFTGAGALRAELVERGILPARATRP